MKPSLSSGPFLSSELIIGPGQGPEPKLDIYETMVICFGFIASRCLQNLMKVNKEPFEI